MVRRDKKRNFHFLIWRKLQKQKFIKFVIVDTLRNKKQKFAIKKKRNYWWSIRLYRGRMYKKKRKKKKRNLLVEL